MVGLITGDTRSLDYSSYKVTSMGPYNGGLRSLSGFSNTLNPKLRGGRWEESQDWASTGTGSNQRSEFRS